MTTPSVRPGFMPPTFTPLWGFANPHAQTLAGKAFRRPPSLAMTPIRIDTPDGDFLDLLYSPGVGDVSRPLVLVLHGLEGSARRRYMRSLYYVLEREGIAAVGLSFRGCSGEPNRLARAYHSGETDDVNFVLNELARRFPGRPMGLVGVSLGGNVALKLLGEGTGDAPRLVGLTRLEAAAVVSVPFDLGASARHLEHGGIYRVYQAYFLRSLKSKIQAKAHLLKERIDLKRASETTTLREFDELVTAPLHGFQSADEYYDNSSSKNYLAGISCPTLVVQAMDDPFLPTANVPLGPMSCNPAITSSLTETGGHLGFVSRSSGACRFWAEQHVANFLSERFMRQAPLDD